MPRIAVLSDLPKHQALVSGALWGDCVALQCKTAKDVVEIVATGTIDMVIADVADSKGNILTEKLLEVHEVAAGVSVIALAPVSGEAYAAMEFLHDLRVARMFWDCDLSSDILAQAISANLPPDPIKARLGPILASLENTTLITFVNYCLRYAHDSITVHSAAQVLQVSYARLERAFESFGLTPTWLLRSSRMLVAARALKRTGGKIPEQMATSLGFTSIKALQNAWMRYTEYPINAFDPDFGFDRMLNSVASQMKVA